MDLTNPLQTVGGMVALYLVRLSLDRAVRVWALAGDIALCSWARHLTRKTLNSQKQNEANNKPYYLAAIVRPLWLAADRARFSCNGWALWNLFWFLNLSGKFAIELVVIKTKIVSLSKKLRRKVLIASPGSFRLSEHHLEWRLARPSGLAKLLPVFLLYSF